jgi:hypothetical protein
MMLSYSSPTSRPPDFKIRVTRYLKLFSHTLSSLCATAGLPFPAEGKGGKGPKKEDCKKLWASSCMLYPLKVVGNEN